jgi:hypothetical protein
MTVSTSCNQFGAACIESLTAQRNFTVTSPGDFVLSSLESISAEAIICNPIACSPEPIVNVSYNGGVGISGPASAGIGFSGSGSKTGPPGTTVVFLTLNDAPSQAVFLPTGDYAMVTTFSINVSGPNEEVSSGSFLTDSLVPVPEPRNLAAVFLAILVIAFVKKARANSVGSR